MKDWIIRRVLEEAHRERIWPKTEPRDPHTRLKHYERLRDWVAAREKACREAREALERLIASDREDLDANTKGQP